MVTGARHDASPRRGATDKLLIDLDRFASTPTGSLILVLLTALVRLALPTVIRRRKAKKNAGRVTPSA